MKIAHDIVVLCVDMHHHAGLKATYGSEMAFRADESAERNFKDAEHFLTASVKYANERERRVAKDFLQSLVHDLGPVVDSYPTWHPLVSRRVRNFPVTLPGTECGYEGLDHSRFFAQGFVTCPYGEGKEVFESVVRLNQHLPSVATLEAERLDVKLYHADATPIVVRCRWDRELGPERTIPLKLAMPLLLEQELPQWRISQVGESWETMRRYFLGAPHGSRSSLFVSQETGQRMKKVWEALLQTGMFGPIAVD